MELWELAGAAGVGFAAGITSGLIGVGGGVLFVPGLIVFLGLSQLGAEATSLVAVVMVALVGAWRQHGYGNVRLRDGLVVGALSPLGVAAGTVLANAVSERALELSFAGVQLYFAWRLGRRALFPPAAQSASVRAGGDPRDRNPGP
jgi:uncharacterized membrane protein YfcA